MEQGAVSTTMAAMAAAARRALDPVGRQTPTPAGATEDGAALQGEDEDDPAAGPVRLLYQRHRSKTRRAGHVTVGDRHRASRHRDGDRPAPSRQRGAPPAADAG